MNLLIPIDAIDRSNFLLAMPRHRRGDLLDLTEPRITSDQFNNWITSKFLDLGTQAVIGDSSKLKSLADHLEANAALGVRCRYTGGDMLKVLTLQAISQIGLPMRCAREIINLILKRAVTIIIHDPGDECFIFIRPGSRDGYEISTSPDQGQAAWQIIIRIDKFIHRFLTQHNVA